MLRLPPWFYDYAPAVSDFHVQAMAVHQVHAQQGCDAHCVYVNVSWPTVPDHCGAVDVEGHHRTVPSARADRLRITKGNSNSATSSGGKAGGLCIKSPRSDAELVDRLNQDADIMAQNL